MNEENAVPTGLDSISIAGNPTLKRGANKHCAYGAGPLAGAPECGDRKMGTELESGEPKGIVCIDDGARNSNVGN